MTISKLWRVTCLCVAFSFPLLAQPRRTACLQWDQAYNQIVVIGLAGAAIASVVFWLAAVFVFGRHAWWAASPRARIWIAALTSGSMAVAVVVVWPRVFGVGRAIFSAVDPQYVNCQATPFGAPGLLYGAIGKTVPAFSQWPAITGLLYGAAMVGGTVAWIISEAMVRSAGLQTTAQGGEV